MAERDTIVTMWALPTFGQPLLRRLAASLDTWLAVHRSRQALLRLDSRLLRDVGITRAEALAEARRSGLSED